MAALADHREKTQAFGVELCRVVFFQHAPEAVDGSQRRAQVVRHAVGKGFEFPIGGFEFRRALPDANFHFLGLPLQLLVQPRLGDGNRELGSHFAGDLHLFRGKCA